MRAFFVRKSFSQLFSSNVLAKKSPLLRKTHAYNVDDIYTYSGKGQFKGKVEIREVEIICRISFLRILSNIVLGVHRSCKFGLSSKGTPAYLGHSAC